jgi:hypothetical protein
MMEEAHPNGRLFTHRFAEPPPDGYYLCQYVVRFKGGRRVWLGQPLLEGRDELVERDADLRHLIARPDGGGAIVD